jgi:hypothetical protein
MPDGDAKMIPAKKLFGYSLLYLFGDLRSLLVDALVSKWGFRRGGVIMDRESRTDRTAEEGTAPPVCRAWRLPGCLRCPVLRRDDHQDRPRHLRPADVRRNR